MYRPSVQSCATALRVTPCQPICDTTRLDSNFFREQKGQSIVQRAMTPEQTAQAQQRGANLEGFQSDVPLHIRFPVRSRKAAAEDMPELLTSREDLYLAPAHEAVLSLANPDEQNTTDYARELPDLAPSAPAELSRNGDRPFNLPLTITAVSGHPSEVSHQAQCASSSAGASTAQCTACSTTHYLASSCMQCL